MTNPFANPVFALDIRSRVRERRLWILAVFFVLTPLALSLIALMLNDPSKDPFPSMGAVLSGFALFSHGALLVLMSALGAAQRISQERERRTLPALVNSPLSPCRIADGKLLGAWTFTLWLAFLTLPFLAVASLWGGMSFPALLMAWLFNVAAAMAAASLALGLSGLFGRSLSAYLATGAVLFLWCAVVPAVGGLLMAVTTAFGGRVSLALSFQHLPLAPQIMMFEWAMSHEPLDIWPCVWALFVWALLAFFGRLLAIRGLRREVY